MTPEQIEAIVQRALSHGVAIHGSDYVLVVLAAALASAIGGYLAAYLSEKGKRYAEHQELARIVESQQRTARAVEEVKAQVAGRTWLHQQLWNERKALLAGILTELAAIGNASARMRNALALMTDGVQKTAREEAGSAFRESDAQMRSALAEIRQLAAIAELVLSGASRQELERFLAEFDRQVEGHLDGDFARVLERRTEAAREAFARIAASGRAELSIPSAASANRAEATLQR